jgi:hypothetical protein
MNPDYELLLPLRADERFELLRGRRRRTGAPVLLKRARREPPPAADLAALQREVALGASLSTAATLLPRWIETPPNCSPRSWQTGVCPSAPCSTSACSWPVRWRNCTGAGSCTRGCARR